MQSFNDTFAEMTSTMAIMTMTSRVWLMISTCHHHQRRRSAVEAVEAGEGHVVAEGVVEVGGAGAAEEVASQVPVMLLWR